MPLSVLALFAPRRSPWFVAALALAAIAGSLQAAPGSYLVREWHREDGLPNEIVTDVMQDGRGYLWLASTAGIVRFDGRDFVTHVPDEHVHPSRSPLLAIFEHPKGLWVVPRLGDPMLYHEGAFTAIPLPKEFAGRAITAALLAPDGSEWLALRGNLVLRRRGATVEQFDADHGVPIGVATRFATDGHGSVWVASDRFLARYEGGALVPVDLGEPTTEVRVATSRVGGPWVVTQDKVLKLDGAYRAQPFAALPPLLGAHYVTAAREDTGGRLWLGTRSQGVHCIRPAGAEHVPTSHDSIYAINIDTDGTLWVGSNGGGLNAIGTKIHRLYDRGAGLIENVNYALAQAPDGSIWSANGDGGLVHFNGDEITVTGRSTVWPRFGVVAVAAASDGTIWLGGSPGLYRFEPGSSEPARPMPNVGARGAARLFVDHTAALWMAADSGQVGRWTAAEGYVAFGEADGFHGGDVRCFAEDRKGALWIGTSQGLLLQRSGSRFVDVGFTTPVPTGAINGIQFDPDRSLWLATAQAGLAVVRDGKATLLGTAAGLPDNNLTQLVSDNHGFLWCGSGNGIFRLSRLEVKRYLAGEIRSLNPMQLGRDDGLKSISCMGVYFPGALKAADGRLWFATRQGVLVIDPSAPILNSGPRRVAIEQATADGAVLALDGSLRVRPQTKKLELKFSVLCLSSSHRTHTQYRLDGFDSEWISAGTANVASYPRLPAGTYVFHVQAFGGANEREPVEDRITVVVPAPWWQTPWVLTAAFAIGLLAVVAAVRTWFNRRLRRRVEALERERAVERERSRIAQNIHDDIGASLTQISLLTQSAVTENSPDKLRQIYETTREITQSLDEIVWAVNPRHDSLESFATYLGGYGRRFLAAAGIRCRLDIPDELPALPLTSQLRHHLFLCCREALHNVVKHARATEVAIQLRAVDGELTVVISDNGMGVDSAAPAKGAPGSGNGLRNMRERMQAVAGDFALVGSPERPGTTVTLRVGLK